MKYLFQHNLMARFLEQVTATPDATALIMGVQTYTYRQVNERSNQVARALRALGVTTDTLVGICMPRSAEAIFAVCGVIKAGGAYVPIDPAYPAARQRFMVTDAKLQILLTDCAERGTPLADSVPHILAMNDDSWQQSHETTNLVVPVAENGLFHVLYTSGSTGHPKGVCGSHSQTRHRIQWFVEAFPVSSQEVWCNKTTLHFADASIEIFGALLHGAPLLILPETTATNPQAMVAVLAEQKVTRLLLVVSHLRMLLLAQPDLGQRLPLLNLWVVNGERLTHKLVQNFYTATAQAQLVNLYGSTEVPDISFIPVAADFSGAEVPIGYPVPESTVYIVNEKLEPVPNGEVGELVVSGPGMALSYLQRPDETAARFLDHPFAATGRIYRTGDRAYQTPDGLLYYVGRLDNLVKIRGYRVELPEVEAALTQADPAIDVGVVVVKEDPQLAENKQLIAFVTPQTIDVTKLTTILRTRLPAYMLPSQIIPLAQFPLTLSGKVDRQTLLATVQPQGVQAPRANATPLEIITQLWRAVLQVEHVTPDANFFEAGGNSLRLAQLYQQLRHIFGERTPTLTALLQYPTIESQAQYFKPPAKSLPEKSTMRPMNRTVIASRLRARRLQTRKVH